MPDAVHQLGGTPVLVCAADGPPLRDERDAADLVGVALSLDASWVAVPVERLAADFFHLRSRVAGGIVQKFVNYRLGVAVVGDVSGHTAASEALRAFVAESNRGTQVWFVPDLAALAARLERHRPRR